MAKCIIICAGEFDRLIAPIEAGDYLIAADGGVRHFEKTDRSPDEILGDFDSLGYVPAGSTVFPVEKDDTDAMLAIRRGLALGYQAFVLYGSLDGPRLDHTVANFQALQFLADRGASGWLVGISQMVTVVQDGKLELPADYRGNISVFCMGAPARGVSIRGLKYALSCGELTAGFPLGVSNGFTGQPSEISVENGSLLVILDRQSRLPE